jgi:GGDEF domain-containing protein
VRAEVFASPTRVEPEKGPHVSGDPSMAVHGHQFPTHRKKSVENIIVDRVTGAFNRRQLDIDHRARTCPLSTATLMIDVDDFERYKRGEVSADQVLSEWRGS